MNEHGSQPEPGDDEVIDRLRSALDEVHSADASAPMPVSASGRSTSNGRWFAIAAAVALVAVGVAAIAVNRGRPAPGSTDSLTATTTIEPPTTVPTVEEIDPNWFELKLADFTAGPLRTEACCPPMPAPGPATVMAWGDVNGLDHGALLLTATPKLDGGEPQLDWKWLMMPDDRANTLISEVVPGSGLPYVLPSQSMQLIGNGLEGIGNLRSQTWTNGTGTVDITVGDYRGQLAVLSGTTEPMIIAGRIAWRVRRDGVDTVVWQTPDGRWATVFISDALASREDEILAAIGPVDVGPDLTMPSTSITTPSTDPASSTVVLRGAASVIDSGKGPMLANVLRSSLPPQGGDIPIDGFDWSMVDDEQTVGGVTWTERWYTFTGTWDGTTFHLLEPPIAYVPVKGGPAPDYTPTPNCTEADLMPLLDSLQAAIQSPALHISTSAGIQAGGRCDADVTAWFDSDALRAALAPFGDQVRVTYLFEPLHR